MIAIHGRMYAVGAVASNYLTVGAYTSDMVVGDTIMLYSNVGKPTGSAVIKSITSVPIPSGIDPNAVDTVFNNQWGGYAWWKVRCAPAGAAPLRGRRHGHVLLEQLERTLFHPTAPSAGKRCLSDQ